MGKVSKTPIDMRRLTIDPHLREEVARAIGDRLRRPTPSGKSANDVEATFKAATMQTVALVAPPQGHKIAGRGWNGHAQSEA